MMNNIKCPICQTIWIPTVFDCFLCVNCDSEIPLKQLKEIIERELISKFLHSFEVILKDAKAFDIEDLPMAFFCEQEKWQKELGEKEDE